MRGDVKVSLRKCDGRPYVVSTTGPAVDRDPIEVALVIEFKSDAVESSCVIGARALPGDIGVAVVINGKGESFVVAGCGVLVVSIPEQSARGIKPCD